MCGSRLHCHAFHWLMFVPAWEEGLGDPFSKRRKMLALGKSREWWVRALIYPSPRGHSLKLWLSLSLSSADLSSVFTFLCCCCRNCLWLFSLLLQSLFKIEQCSYSWGHVPFSRSLPLPPTS